MSTWSSTCPEKCKQIERRSWGSKVKVKQKFKKKHAEESIARSQFEAQHAQKSGNILGEEAKRVWLLKTQEVEAEKKQSTQNNQPLTEDEMMCDHCEEEFTSKKLNREHTHSCPICNVTFKQYPYCLLDHMRSNHEELYYIMCAIYRRKWKLWKFKLIYVTYNCAVCHWQL